MRRVVLHPSAFVAWVEGSDTPALRPEFEGGQLEVLVPRTFAFDALGVLATRGWSARQLVKAAVELDRIGFRMADPPAAELADWLTRGIPVPAAVYAAIASWLDAPIAVADEELRKRFNNLPQEPI